MGTLSLSALSLTCRHGGQEVSTYLKENLHKLTEEATRSQIPDIIAFTQTHGGYFKRWRGGALQRWTKHSLSEPATDRSVLTMEERLTLAFLSVSPICAERGYLVDGDTG